MWAILRAIGYRSRIAAFLWLTDRVRSSTAATPTANGRSASQPLTAPATSPLTIQRCATRTSSATGSVARVLAARI